MPGSAVPVTFGLLSFAGEAGVVASPVGVRTPDSSSYANAGDEQLDTLPTPSVAVA
jgi:hypothetical protein